VTEVTVLIVIAAGVGIAGLLIGLRLAPVIDRMTDDDDEDEVTR
jgi:hypothetical protein